MMREQPQTISAVRHDWQAMMGDRCQGYGGQLFQASPDTMALMYFPSAVQAVTCAIDIQKELSQVTLNISPDALISPRLGIHLGDVVLSETNLVGEGVAIAARLLAEASPGSICISKTVYDVVKARLHLKAVSIGTLGMDEPYGAIDAFEIFPMMAAAASSEPEHLKSSSPNTLINNRYQIQRVLGRGGFGQTYLANDTYRFNDLCVLKEFIPLTQSPRLIEKSRGLFEQEARVLYQISHPQIPKFLAWFAEHERLFIVQEYIDGQTYADLVRDRQHQGHLFSEAELIQWLWDLLPVLDYIHSLNIVHRDISPENIMLPVQGDKPVLIDFGVVKEIVSQIWTGHPSSHGSVVGKFGYAPPEQMRLGQCFPCSDLYALAMTATVLLTGQKPSPVPDVGSLTWQQFLPQPLSDRTTQILERMLAERPKDRYQSVQQVIADLHPLVAPHRAVEPSRAIAPQPLPLSESIAPGAAPAGAVHPHPGAAGATPSEPTALDDPMPEAAPAPSTASCSAEFLSRCRQQLSRCIGPMAAIVLEDVLAQQPQPTPDQLIHALAHEIPDAQLAHDFRQAFQQVASTRSPTPSGVQTATPRRSPSPSLSQSPLQSTQALSPAILQPEFIEHCQQTLTQCVGPIAQYVIDDALSDDPNMMPHQLMEAIAIEIPDVDQAREFRRRLTAFL